MKRAVRSPAPCRKGSCLRRRDHHHGLRSAPSSRANGNEAHLPRYIAAFVGGYGRDEDDLNEMQERVRKRVDAAKERAQREAKQSIETRNDSGGRLRGGEEQGGGGGGGLNVETGTRDVYTTNASTGDQEQYNQTEPQSPSTRPGSSGRGDDFEEEMAAAREARERLIVFPRQVRGGEAVTILYDALCRDAIGACCAGDMVAWVGFNDWKLHKSKIEMSFYEAGNFGYWAKVTVYVPEEATTMEVLIGDESETIWDRGSGWCFPVTSSPQSEKNAPPTASRAKVEEYREMIREEGGKAAMRRCQAEAKRRGDSLEILLSEESRGNDFREAEEIVAARDRNLEHVHIVENNRMEGVFELCTPATAGQHVTIAYNRISRCLQHSNIVHMHVGYDGWVSSATLPMERIPHDAEERRRSWQLQHGNGDWWWATSTIPLAASVLDFVFSDGETLFDNNGGADYHIRVDGQLSFQDRVKHTSEQLSKERLQERKAMIDKVQRQALRRATKHQQFNQAELAEREKKIFSTHPRFPRAGEPVTIFFKQNRLTVMEEEDAMLDDRVYLQVGFNRWRSHSSSSSSSPILMSRIMRGSAVRTATIEVPPDAHVLDIKIGSSIFESQITEGADYHVNVQGASGLAPTLHIAHVAVEMAPIAKVGGLGDVVTSLSIAVQEEGHKLEVVLPKYDSVDYGAVSRLREYDSFEMHNGVTVKVWKGVIEGFLSVTFLEPLNGEFWVGCIYGRSDDAQRFANFTSYALEWLQQDPPDIIHCHDWSTAPVAWENTSSSRVIFTIHNLGYGADLIRRAVACADAVTTVSPTYADEIRRELGGANRLIGIRNGIDPNIWDPLEDPFIPVNYEAGDATRGKRAAASALRARFDMSDDPGVPLVSVVSRLTEQKGIHLIKASCWRVVEEGGHFVLLGSAPDTRIQSEFEKLARDVNRKHPGMVAFHFTYDEPLSHLVYAASDIIVVPSIFEPCGLTQLIAMRYGALPLVRATGGLRDTVFDVDNERKMAKVQGIAANGFTFESTHEQALFQTIDRAMREFKDSKS